MLNCFTIDSCVFSASKMRQFQKFVWNYDLEMALHYDYDQDKIYAKVSSFYLTDSMESFIITEGQYLACKSSIDRTQNGIARVFCMVLDSDQFTL